MKHIIIGTAGHIDHGKTVLTRALTGVDTDRLPEEKAREMSIDLGFAPLPLTDELAASVVDVPGHEKFVKNMVAGVTGVDLILLVVAADDGIMPQTREHLQILELLGIRNGVVVITKIDLVPPDRVKTVERDVLTLVKHTFLEQAPVVKVSATQNIGLQELREVILRVAKETHPRRFDQIPRLPVDRVFSMPGFGTVITGTLISGSMEVGQPVEILPQKKKARVRGIQVHQSPVSRAIAGQRTALNLKDIAKHELQRGDVVTNPGVIESTALVDVKVELLRTAARPLKHLGRVRLHIGTSEVMSRIALLESKELLPGGETFAQMRLERPVVALRNDRFILRSYSPQTTIGGGIILDAYPRRRRRSQASVEHLKALDSQDNTAVVEHMLLDRQTGLMRDVLLRLTNVSPSLLDAILETLEREGRVVLIKKNVMHTRLLEEWERRIMEEVDSTFGGRMYISKGELMRSVSGGKDDGLIEALLARLAARGVIELKADKVRLASRADRFADLKAKIEKLYRESGYQPPAADELETRTGTVGAQLKDLVSELLNEGVLIKVADGVIFHREVLNRAIQVLRGHFASQPEVTVSEFRKLLNTSRKYAVPLLEYLDSVGVTVRSGDFRRLKS